MEEEDGRILFTEKEHWISWAETFYLSNQLIAMSRTP